MNRDRQDMRCDNCGKQVYEKDLGNGATCDVVGHGVSGEVWEVICKPCNEEFNRKDFAA